MEKCGGKYLFRFITCCCIVIMSISCDKSQPINLNDVKDLSLSSQCGTVIINSSIFSNMVFLNYKINGKFTFEPDSLMVNFYPSTIRMVDLKYQLNSKDIASNEIYYLTNGNNVFLSFRIISDKVVSLDTCSMLILPCNYIICDNRPLITDTININLK